MGRERGGACGGVIGEGLSVVREWRGVQISGSTRVVWHVGCDGVASFGVQERGIWLGNGCEVRFLVGLIN